MSLQILIAFLHILDHLEHFCIFLMLNPRWGDINEIYVTPTPYMSLQRVTCSIYTDIRWHTCLNYGPYIYIYVYIYIYKCKGHDWPMYVIMYCMYIYIYVHTLAKPLSGGESPVFVYTSIQTSQYKFIIFNKFRVNRFVFVQFNPQELVTVVE